MNCVPPGATFGTGHEPTGRRLGGIVNGHQRLGVWPLASSTSITPCACFARLVA